MIWQQSSFLPNVCQLHRHWFLFIALIVWVAGSVACGTSVARPATILFERSGGLAGLDDRLTIDLTTGTAQLQRRKEVLTTTLSAEQRSRLATLIAALDLANLAATPASPHQCCDFLSYRIQIDAITIQTTDADLPASLQPLVTELNAIITGLHTR
ncbi:hypothetical protein A6A03_02950 [Chloroflexus islandicus]|uniref:Uncharacterized protein n=1 Tax=Chloroflexus islandicus TaxID=1707952 RepID=A0A178M5U5_9CHLR|nr:protealysin inhibitor emfourin [Chloroflexus islandicus]OAN44122.1 hypothetical protein A6A03_02950 [Chloroflexus islandicus]